MVFAGVYPADGSDYDALNAAVERLTCNDASVSVSKESSGALGVGFRSDMAENSFVHVALLVALDISSVLKMLLGCGRCGFLGLLHMDVFLQRLEQVLVPAAERIYWCCVTNFCCQFDFSR